MKIKFPLLAFIILFCGFAGFAQQHPIGTWRSYPSYNGSVSIATNGTRIFAASDQSFFVFNVSQDEMVPYSKSGGMADVGVSFVDYDQTTGTTIIVYTNTNIDLFKDETFFNIPDIKNRSITGLKRINGIYTENGLSYLATSFGIIVVNLAKKEIKETYSFVENSQNIEVMALSATSNELFAVTPKGVYKANKNNLNLQAFSSWQLIVAKTNLKDLCTFNDTVIVQTTDTALGDSLFAINNNALSFIYRSDIEITGIDSQAKALFVSEYRPLNFNGRVRKLDNNYQIIDSFNTFGKPLQVKVLLDSSTWVADANAGLARREWVLASTIRNPQGPVDPGGFDIYAHNGELWVAHGSVNDNWSPQFTKAGVSHFKDGKWNAYNEQVYRDSLNGVSDFISIAVDPADKTMYAASFRSGVLIVKADGSYELKKENSVFEPTIGDLGSYRVGGVTVDQGGNTWFTMAGTVHDLAVKTKSGEYFKYTGAGAGLYAAYPIVDDYNQKWYLLTGNGLAVYNDNNTPENGNDDSYARVPTSLVNNNVNCLVKDQEGAIWFGTNDGIGVINCPGQILTGGCQVDRPIVQYDQFAGYLFQNEIVKTIAVDGANRKWIGTTNGAWLVSPNADKIINRFTVETSPLPSNIIQKIAVDPVTGEVYFGTSKGLVSYRGTATEGGETIETITTFPNPVPFGYAGTIAIKGLAANVDVRITDISGQLVFRTTALGGQAIWNGLDYTGKRPQSGVYLIFVTNKDGSQTKAGKLVFLQ